MDHRPKQRNQPIQLPKDPPKPNHLVPAIHSTPHTHNPAHGATQRSQAQIAGNGGITVHPSFNTTPGG